MTVTIPKGFVANGIACGIKASGDPDLTLVASESGEPILAVAVFTQNLAAAAPVKVSKRHLQSTGNRAVAVVLNSGNANAANGKKGMSDAEAMCAAIGEQLGISPELVLVCSTGLIGIPLDVAPIQRGAAELTAGLEATEAGAVRAARAIMTTDTVPKTASFTGTGYSIGSIAKGAAMLAPNMATMLSVITTDAKVDADLAQYLLREAVEHSFNRLVIDGCTSTNDTVILLCSGAGEDGSPDEFREGLISVCNSLADQMAMDAEGAHKLVRLSVAGAASDQDALVLAKKAAGSQLVQCSFYGSDPYWGRLASEFGTAGVDFDLDQLEVSYQGIKVASGGVAADHDAAKLKVEMDKREILVTCKVGKGPGSATVTTTDLSPEYIAENMRTS